MLIADNPPFLFIHVDKAAGTSIQAALRPFAIAPSRSRLRKRLVMLGGLNRFLQTHHLLEFPEHVTADVVKKCLPAETYTRLFKFACVRNPWDRMVSKYAHLLRKEQHPRHERVKAMGDFTEFLEFELDRAEALQSSYVCDADGRFIVDFVGYFEKLPDHFTRVCEHLKIQPKLENKNTSEHKDYRSYYTTATRGRVAKHFQRDIELFGYEFDGLPANATPKGLKANT
jgi:hypothetical protein